MVGVIDDFNPYTSFAPSISTMTALTLPSPLVVTPTYEFEPNRALLAGEPTTEVSAAGKQTIHYAIADGAQWSDGTPITSDDFLYLWEMSKAKTSGYFGGYDEIEDVQAPDDATVEVTMRNSYADWEQLFSPLLPSHYIRSVEGNFPSPAKAFDGALKSELPVSSGPMKVENVQAGGSTVELVADESYAGEPSSLAGITLREIADPTASAQALLNGDVDVLTQDPVDLTVYDELESTDVNFEIVPSASFLQLTFNTKSPQLTDSRVRQAIALMVDRQRLVDLLYGGAADEVDELPGNHVLPPGGAGYGDNGVAYDPDKGGALLDDAGFAYRNGEYVKNGEPLSVQVMTVSERPDLLMVTEAVVDQLKSEGIHAVTNAQSADDFGSKHLETHDFEVAVHAWSWTALPADDTIDTYDCQGYANYSQYCMAAADRLLTQAKRTADPAESVDRLNKLDQRLWEDMPTLPLFQRPAMVATGPDVQAGAYNAPAYTAFTDITEWAVN